VDDPTHVHVAPIDLAAWEAYANRDALALWESEGGVAA
jgi:hypothetical protein